MDLTEKVSILKRTSIFSSISEDTLEVISDFAREKRYQDGEVIFQEGEIGNSLYIVARGKLCIMHHEAKLAEMTASDIVGEMALIDDENRSASAIAVGNTILFEITRKSYLDIISFLPSVSLEISKMLARRIRTENDKLFQQHQEIQKQKLIEQELEIAKRIQRGLLPQRIPQIENLEIEAECISARKVGGDFYAFVELRESKTELGVVIGDVAGKGISAAIIMANSKGILCSEASDHIEPSITLKETNLWLWEDTPQNIFLAVFYGIIDTQNLVMTYSCAGQPLPIILRENKEKPFYVPKNNVRVPLGVFANPKYDQLTFKLQPNDLIILCSDGVIEATNPKGEIFGFDRFEQTISQCKNCSPKAALDKILSEIMTFMAGTELYDDSTIIAIKIKK